MIKQGIVNFFKSLKYFFTPLGTLALGLILGLSIAIPGIVSLASSLSADVRTILSGTSVDFSALWDSIENAVSALDWREPTSALTTMLSAEWLTRTISDCASAFTEITDAYVSQFSGAVSAFTNGLATYIVLVVVFLALGAIGGFMLVRWLIRRSLARRTLLRSVLGFIIDTVAMAALVALLVWLFTLWKPGAIITAVVSVLLYGVVALLRGYLVQARGRVPLRKIVTLKNVLALTAGNAVILLLAFACTTVVTAITNAIAGAVIGMVFTEIALIVAGVNAESYVASVAKANEDSRTANGEERSSAA